MSEGSGDPVASPLQAYGATLLGVAEQAIDHGLTHGSAPALEVADWPAPLRAERATFVTLFAPGGALRGCIGSLEARRPLVVDVAENAWAAASEDPRFPPLTRTERPGIDCRISVLTPPEPIGYTDEADILRQLRPGVDGVVVETPTRRGTLLPAVWEQIPDPAEFWRTLKRKAGINGPGLPPDLTVYRYQAESI